MEGAKNRIEVMLETWDPSIWTSEFKKHLWRELSEKIDEEELFEEKLDHVAGGITASLDKKH